MSAHFTWCIVERDQLRLLIVAMFEFMNKSRLGNRSNTVFVACILQIIYCCAIFLNIVIGIIMRKLYSTTYCVTNSFIPDISIASSTTTQRHSQLQHW